MKSLTVLRARRTAAQGWTPAPGAEVEIRQWGNPLRKGVVETVMPDGRGFWLAAEDAWPRLLIHLGSDDMEIWIRQPTHRTPHRVA
ncbi:hypothetical protein ACVWWH_000949 [Sinomonas sp. RB5]